MDNPRGFFCYKPNKTMNQNTTPAPAFVVSAETERAAAAYRAAVECAATLYNLFAQEVAEQDPNAPEEEQTKLIQLRLEQSGIDAAKEKLFAELCAIIRLNLDTSQTPVCL